MKIGLSGDFVAAVVWLEILQVKRGRRREDPRLLGPLVLPSAGSHLPSQPQAVMLPFNPAPEGGERGKRQEKLPPPGIPIPGKHSWRVLEAPGSPVVSEMLLVSRSQAGSISKVLSGWPHLDHSPPWEEPRFINHRIVLGSNMGGDFKENQSKQHMGTATGRNALRDKEVSSS